ncbi:MAG: hypothetical protein SPI58_00405, partial [Candidatus Enteromonas sp.]|nr:hypothetical protein [Candidatus Enteromonas sp.]
IITSKTSWEAERIIPPPTDFSMRFRSLPYFIVQNRGKSKVCGKIKICKYHYMINIMVCLFSPHLGAKKSHKVHRFLERKTEG